MGQIVDSFPGPQIHGIMRNILPIKENLTLIRACQAHNHIKCRGFTCSVGTQEANNILSFNPYTYIVNYSLPAVHLYQTFCLEYFMGHGHRHYLFSRLGKIMALTFLSPRLSTICRFSSKKIVILSPSTESFPCFTTGLPVSTIFSSS